MMGENEVPVPVRDQEIETCARVSTRVCYVCAMGFGPQSQSLTNHFLLLILSMRSLSISSLVVSSLCLLLLLLVLSVSVPSPVSSVPLATCRSVKSFDEPLGTCTVHFNIELCVKFFGVDYRAKLTDPNGIVTTGPQTDSPKGAAEAVVKQYAQLKPLPKCLVP